jgi:hypothetical protein
MLRFRSAKFPRFYLAANRYMEQSERKISRKDLLANLEEKLSDRRFLSDVPPLLKTGLEYDPQKAFALVSDKLLSLIEK